MVVSRKKTVTPPAKGETIDTTRSQPLFVIHGDDDYLATEEAHKVIASLTPKGASDFSLETIDGFAANQDGAASVFRKLFESLQSQSFFATEKVVWWRDTNLLGPGQTATAAATSDFLEALNGLLKHGLPPGVSLVITATELDGRRGITKTFQKMGKVISFKMDPYKEQENQARAISFAHEMASQLDKRLEEEAAMLLVEMSNGDSRTIRSELEKMAAYVGDQAGIQEKDVRAIGSWRPGGVVWDLPDAVGERNLGRVLQMLHNLLFIGETPIGLLFAVISRVRLLLLLNALVEKKLLRTGGDYNSFKSQLDRLPAWVAESQPPGRKAQDPKSSEKKPNLFGMHPFRLYKISSGATRYTRAELQQALETLLECNERLVSSGGDSRSVLEESLIKICMKP